MDKGDPVEWDLTPELEEQPSNEVNDANTTKEVESFEGDSKRRATEEPEKKTCQLKSQRLA